MALLTDAFKSMSTGNEIHDVEKTAMNVALRSSYVPPASTTNTYLRDKLKDNKPISSLKEDY